MKRKKVLEERRGEKEDYVHPERDSRDGGPLDFGETLRSLKGEERELAPEGSFLNLERKKKESKKITRSYKRTSTRPKLVPAHSVYAG